MTLWANSCYYPHSTGSPKGPELGCRHRLSSLNLCRSPPVAAHFFTPLYFLPKSPWPLYFQDNPASFLKQSQAPSRVVTPFAFIIECVLYTHLFSIFLKPLTHNNPFLVPHPNSGGNWKTKKLQVSCTEGWTLEEGPFSIHPWVKGVGRGGESTNSPSLPFLTSLTSRCQKSRIRIGALCS